MSRATKAPQGVLRKPASNGRSGNGPPAAPPEPLAIGRAVLAIVTRQLADSGCETQPTPWPTDGGFRAGFRDRVETFAIELARWGSKLNLTANPDDPTEIAFHIIDSLAPLMLARQTGHGVPAVLFVRDMRVLDLGTGAGFPGLILAAACDADFVLLEARRKRASFLSVTAAAMSLTNVRVEAARAVTLVGEPVYDIVTARAFAEPAITLQTAAAALRPGGRVMLYASPSQRLAIEAACSGRFEPPTLLEYTVARNRAAVAHVLAIACRR